MYVNNASPRTRSMQFQRVPVSPSPTSQRHRCANCQHVMRHPVGSLGSGAGALSSAALVPGPELSNASTSEVVSQTITVARMPSHYLRNCVTWDLVQQILGSSPHGIRGVRKSVVQESRSVKFIVRVMHLTTRSLNPLVAWTLVPQLQGPVRVTGVVEESGLQDLGLNATRNVALVRKNGL